jgi:hypothetical protein
MQNVLVLIGVVVAWFLLVRYVFPRLGIKG